jgi:CHAT domain-containing protein
LQADELAWNNNWSAANPFYIQAERVFRSKGDQPHALYAHVSQFAIKMESGDLPTLIAELRTDLNSAAAQAPEVRLRILEMKAKCEEEYDAAMAEETFAQVETLAFKNRQLHLASRASGEQGILYFTLGNLAEASKRVTRAYAVAKYLDDPAAHVRFAEMIGAGLAHMGRPKQAMKFLDEAIATQRNHSDVAVPFVAYNAKVDSLNQLGSRKEALTLADQALVVPRRSRFLGQMQALLSNRSDVLIDVGRISDAIAGYQEAAKCAKQLHSWRAITEIDGKLAAAYERAGNLPAALDAINEAISANQQTPEEMFQAPHNLTVKARIEAKLGHPGVAELQYQKGMAILDVLLTHVPTPETESLVLTELSDLYSGYFELLTDQGRYDDAFQVIEKAHGRLEAQQLEYDRTEVPHQPTDEDKRLQSLEIALLKEDSGKKRAQALKGLRLTRDEMSGSLLERTVTLPALQAKLASDEFLIEYVLATPKSYAMLIGRTSTSRYTLPSQKTVEHEAGNYRNILRSNRTDVKLGQKLFNELLGFTTGRSDIKSIVIVPDGALHLLPFSALVNSSGSYLLEDTPLSVTPSGTVLSLLRAQPFEAVAKLPYLGVAAWTDSVNPGPWILRSAPPGTPAAELSPLPESRNEVESIAAMMPKPATVLLGHAATRQKFQQLPLSDYRIVHLALHGLVDPIFPDKSALVFAPSGNDDGRLEARDIRRLHLHADLVTLSACDTGVGPVSPSGVESVVAAFVEAGARSVVSTLWELEDHSSNVLMKDFYSRLSTTSEADALRQAKLGLLHSGLSPYYWASYEIVGDSQRLLSTTK